MTLHEKTAQVRRAIIQATDELLYRKGYNAMSFSDIAEASHIPRGNLNYHFKTKHAVLNAVIEYRLEQTRILLDDWERRLSTPLQRLKRYAQIPLKEIKNVRKFGCPMGSLNTELGKQQADLQAVSRKQFDLFRTWLKRQFAELLPHENADHLAIHLLVRTQGIAVLAQSYRDKGIVQREVDGVWAWLDQLAAPLA